MENPFDHHRPVEPGRLLDRQDERARLHGYLESGRNVLVYGPRRRGKTSLVLHVLQGLPTIPLYVDATRKPHPAELGAALLKQLATTGLARGKRFRRWLVDRAAELAVDVQVGRGGVTFTIRRQASPDDPDDTGPLLDALQFLEEVAQAHDQRFTVCIDEFQVAMPSPGLVAGLRSVAQHQRRVNYVLSGSEATVLRELNQDRASPFYKQLTELQVDGVTIDRIRAEVETMFGTTFDEEGLDQLRSSTGDNTLRLVQVLRHAYALGAGLGRSAIRDAVAAAIHENSSEYERILALVKPGNQRDVLFALARDRPEHITGADFLQRHRLGTPAFVQRATAALRRLQVLDEDNRFLDPLFPVYLAE